MQSTDKFRIESKIQAEIEKLLDIAEGYAVSNAPAHTIEKGLFSQLLILGRVLLGHIFMIRIRKLREQFGIPERDGQLLRSKGKESRQYLSLFGLIKIERLTYWSKTSGKVHPTDGELSLPMSSHWSYLLEELVGETSAECDYKESVVVLNKLLGLRLSGKSSARNSEHIGKEVESYYDAKPVFPTLEPLCFSGSFDAKGVPKIKPKSGDEIVDNPKKRLGKGEKKGVMEMATVSVTSSFTPKKRSVDSIIRSLMGSPLSKVKADKSKPVEKDKQDNKWHKDIHKRAFLADQNKAVTYGLDWIKSRMKNPESRFVVPIDAGIGLEEKVLSWVEENGMEKQFDGIILDIIHASEYVWDAATAIFGEKSSSRSIWVQDVLTDLLNSKTVKVIDDLKRINAKTKLSESKRKQVEKTIIYFTNHQHKMDYKTFIEKGYPVSSALVEAACGHLVKERMEQSGMRWSSKGAQNIMDLRAVKLNGDMEDFMEFRIKKEQMTAFKFVA